MDHIEKHLIMAKAASLAAEERALSSLDQQLGLPKGAEFCAVIVVMLSQLFINPGPCQLPYHLDETLLQQHHLLMPSSYLITSQPSVAAPQRQYKLSPTCVVDVIWFAL